MEAPKARATSVKATRVVAQKSYGDKPAKVTAALPELHVAPPDSETLPKKIFVHIKDPDDHAALLKLKEVCMGYPGLNDIVLVLGEEKKSALRLPFKVDGSDALIGALVRDLGEDSVVLK
jgi:hypothetical protein